MEVRPPFFMLYFLLFVTVVSMASSNILATFYNRASANLRGTAPFYNLLRQGSIFLCWLVLFLFQGGADVAILPYAFLFAVFFLVCSTVSVYGVRTGPLMLTTLISQMSLIATALWGLFFWGEDFSILVGVGLVMVVLSIYLCLKEGKETEKKSITLIWLVIVSIMFITNAGASIVQTTQQMKFDGAGGAFLMVVATGISALANLILYVRSDRSDTPVLFRRHFLFPILAGVGNVLLNLLVIYLATQPISKSLTFPTLAIGGLAITVVFSHFVFHEKMRWWQWTGVALGAIAVGILSI